MTHTSFNRKTWPIQLFFSIPFIFLSLTQLISFFAACELNVGGIDDSCVLFGIEAHRLFEISQALMFYSMFPPIGLLMLLSMAATLNLFIVFLIFIKNKNEHAFIFIITALILLIIASTYGRYAWHLAEEKNMKKENADLAEFILSYDYTEQNTNTNQWKSLDLYFTDDIIKYPNDWTYSREDRYADLGEYFNFYDENGKYKKMMSDGMRESTPLTFGYTIDNNSNDYIKSFCNNQYNDDFFKRCRKIKGHNIRVNNNYAGVSVEILIPKENNFAMIANFKINSRWANENSQTRQSIAEMIYYTTNFSDNINYQKIITNRNNPLSNEKIEMDQFNNLIESLTEFKCSFSLENDNDYMKNINEAYKATQSNNYSLSLQHLDWARKKMINQENFLKKEVIGVSHSIIPDDILEKYENKNFPPTDILQDLGYKILLVDNSVKNNGILSNKDYLQIKKELGLDSYLYANIHCAK
ncbi:MAG: hypothetical protein RBR98_00850 [Candidatus Moranbacteria bacterium]|jgi:hypothetical protein|nr:hypothetical protein [Candidatus Moranbacteria bacterium]